MHLNNSFISCYYIQEKITEIQRESSLLAGKPSIRNTNQEFSCRTPGSPHIEARTKTKGTIYKIRIPTKKVTTPTATSLPEQQQRLWTEPASSVKQQQTEIGPQSKEKIWTPLTTRTIDKHFNTSVTQELLMDDLLLSESDTSISSTDTVCLDEPKEQNMNFLPAHVYNAFKNF